MTITHSNSSIPKQIFSAAKCRQLIFHPASRFLQSIIPSRSTVHPLQHNYHLRILTSRITDVVRTVKGQFSFCMHELIVQFSSLRMSRTTIFQLSIQAPTIELVYDIIKTSKCSILCTEPHAHINSRTQCAPTHPWAVLQEQKRGYARSRATSKAHTQNPKTPAAYSLARHPFRHILYSPLRLSFPAALLIHLTPHRQSITGSGTCLISHAAREVSRRRGKKNDPALSISRMEKPFSRGRQGEFFEIRRRFYRAAADDDETNGPRTASFRCTYTWWCRAARGRAWLMRGPKEKSASVSSRAACTRLAEISPDTERLSLRVAYYTQCACFWCARGNIVAGLIVLLQGERARDDFARACAASESRVRWWWPLNGIGLWWTRYLDVHAGRLVCCGGC